MTIPRSGEVVFVETCESLSEFAVLHTGEEDAGVLAGDFLKDTREDMDRGEAAEVGDVCEAFVGGQQMFFDLLDAIISQKLHRRGLVVLFEEMAEV
jgi:hypothetical protein